jgi:hypothetical protein
MANEFSFNQQDANLKVTTALPAASSNNQTATIDLGAGGNFQPPYEVEIAVPAMPLHVTANNVTLRLQDSADNSTFADVDPQIQTLILGVVSTGSAAKNVRFRLPSTIRRYIQFTQTTGATDTLTSYSMVYTLRF